MALKSITIENFKCIGDAVTIPIRPITLLFGKNSSGKSTVIQALIYMSEVLKSTEFDPKLLPIGLLDPNRTGGGLDPDRTGIGGDYIDLGSFHSLVHRHELGREIRIRIEFDSSILEEPYSLFERESHDEIPDEITLSITDLLSIDEPSLESMWLEMVIGWDDKKGRTKQSAFSLGLNGIEWFRTIKEHPESPGTEWYRLEEPNDIYCGYFNLAHPLIDKNLEFLEFMSTNAKNSYFNITEEIVKIGKLELSDIRYLGPLRRVPPRNFDPQKTSDESLWATGLEAWNILGRDSTAVISINSYMKDILKLGYTIDRKEYKEYKEYTLTEQVVDTIEQSPRLIRLKLHDEKNDIDLDPLDVGLGISQVIPVLVGIEKESGVFAVENPELHLHPAAQVALGDVFIDGIQNSHCTMLIETHSEHLLLRLLRRVRETTEGEQTDHTLTPDDLSVVYVRPTPEGIKFTPISITDDGSFYAPWPEGFFAERVKELF